MISEIPPSVCKQTHHDEMKHGNTETSPNRLYMHSLFDASRHNAGRQPNVCVHTAVPSRLSGVALVDIFKQTSRGPGENHNRKGQR